MARVEYHDGKTWPTVTESRVVTLPPLEFVLPNGLPARPHRGTAEYPGGQVAVIRACLTHKVVSVLTGRDVGKSILLFFLFFEEGRLCRGHYHFGFVSQGHADAERVFKQWRAAFAGAGDGFLVESTNKGQFRSLTIRPFGENEGATVYFWSGEPDAIENVRGVRLNRLAVDEAGGVSKKVLTVCGPMLTSRKGKSLYVGTARRGGMGSGWFKDAFDRGIGPEPMPAYKSFNWPSESNPYSDPEDVLFERMKLRDPRRPSEKTPEEIEEFDGAFVSGLGACFRNLDPAFCLRYREIERNTLYIGVDANDNPLEPIPGRRYIIGVDWATKYDYAVFSVWDMETRHQVELRIEAPGDKGYDEKMDRLVRLRGKWNDAYVVADDRDAGGHLNEQLRKVWGERIKRVKWTAGGENNKALFVERAKHLFDAEVWKFLAVPYQLDEFVRYTQTPIGEHSNGFRYEAPAGRHDDTVSAALFIARELQDFAPKPKPPPPKRPPMLSPAWMAQQAEKQARRWGRRGF